MSLSFLPARSRAVLAAGLLPMGAACFAYMPARTTLSPGAQVALQLSPEGQVALAATVGPGVQRVEGTLVTVDGEEFVLSEPAVTLTRGYQAPLDVSPLRISNRYVSVVQERRLSRGRTYPVLGGAIVLVAAFFVTRGLVGRGTPPETPGGVPPPIDNQRWFPEAPPPDP